MTLIGNQRKRGFSLIELVIVVVIIGIIGAIAIPRMSRGSEGAADSALAGDLAVLRNAIDLYAAEHQGQFPTVAAIADQLTRLTDGDGNVDDGTGKGGGYIYGPYLRKVPPLPVGSADFKGSTTFTDTPGTIGAGWVYTASTGDVVANLPGSETDSSNKPYNTY